MAARHLLRVPIPPQDVRFLIAESETAEQRESRRRTAGCSSGESYAATLRAIVPAAACDIVRPHETGPASDLRQPLASYDAVFLSGSPLHVYDETPETRRQVTFMRAVFASGTPSFGSCAGLQVAVAAAGGRVAKAARHEIGFARRIASSAAGAAHPLLAGRPPVWDALSIHSDAVQALPEGSVLLAGNALCPIQAAEIRHGDAVFWGVQYHPELTIAEIAAAMRRQVADVVEAGLAASLAAAEQQIALVDALGAEPGRRDLAWRLGVDDQTTDPARRQRELRNFIAAVLQGRMRSADAVSLAGP